MANEDSVTIRINEKLKGESPIFSDHCIFKVPKNLRSMNEKAYEPQLIAIGPYHHGKKHLLVMEDHKIRYLQSLLQRSAQKDISRYVQIIRSLEKRARKCYAEHLIFDHDEFVEMMLIDGCFIIEFICKSTEFHLQEDDKEDPLLRSNHMFTRCMLDLLLLENQLPFFILWELLVTSNVIPDREMNFIRMILKIYKYFLPDPLCNLTCANTLENIMQIKHLLGLLHDCWQPSPARLRFYEKRGEDEESGFMRCATELKDFGIKFKSAGRNNLFDIDFVNSTIKIPKIQIEDRIECILQNLIAYEQLTFFTSPKYFTDYMIFMDSLIDSAKDVELLCHLGIIDNMKGDDESVAILFNKLGKHIFCKRALYVDIVNNVNEHCKKRRKRGNLQMAKVSHDYFQSPWSFISVLAAKLKHDYFQSPWSFISVLAAIILLLLTLTQTVYSIISYYK